MELSPVLPSNPVKEEEISSEYFVKCPQCQKGCQTFQALKEHLENVHADASCASENGMSVHTVSPTPTLIGAGSPFGCAQCSTSFSTKEQLEKHEILHSPNAQVSCKICNKTFANVYRLQRHMISHDESAMLRKFKCTECEKAFKFKHHLKEHIRIHSGEKPFKCGNCGKRFSHSGSYSSHMTSKKCLVMNLKLGRTRPPAGSSSVLDKSGNVQSMRTPFKRNNSSPINNNLATSPNHNSYLPILPKYSEAAAALLQSSLAAGNPTMPPFYLTPHSLLSTAHSMNPYTMPNMPNIGHILEHLQQQNANPLKAHFQENFENSLQEQSLELRVKEENKYRTEDEHDENLRASSSDCGDLVMDEDRYTNATPESSKSKIDTNESPTNNNGDLETVSRILETVSATVTKELLHANMRKMSSDCSSDSHSVFSAASPKQDLSCVSCKRAFETSALLEDHECEDIRSEGLAAKLEDALTSKSDDIPNGNSSDLEYDRLNYAHNDIDSESYTTMDHVNEDGRKVRVRSLISDEQLKILKDNYKLNPRPKREDLEKIATSIGFPIRVVQVWFQNTRARDRREGRLIQVPYSPVARFSVPSNSMMHPTISNQHNTCEQPLDLSIKRDVMTNSNESSPSNSPGRPTSVNHSEINDEVVNLSRKSSRSPTPYMPYQSHYQGSNSSEPRHSPSPLDFNSSRLAQILAQPAHKLGLSGMGLVPMDHLMQFGANDMPSLSHLINSRISSLSPASNHSMVNEQDDHRHKVSQFVLKGLGSPVLSNEPESEGQFSCDQCDKAFAKQSSLARHKYEHSGQRPHKCDECPKAFKHKHHLTEHKRLHSGEKPFQCCKCLKRFSHSGSYSQHMNHRYSYCKPYRE